MQVEQDEQENISDSEEERTRYVQIRPCSKSIPKNIYSHALSRRQRGLDREVIVISSDSEPEDELQTEQRGDTFVFGCENASPPTGHGLLTSPTQRQVPGSSRLRVQDVSITPTRLSHPTTVAGGNRSDMSTATRSITRVAFDDVIDISTSSDEERGPSATLQNEIKEDLVPWEVDDGSTLILDEPRRARKPLRIPTLQNNEHWNGAEGSVLKDTPLLKRLFKHPGYSDDEDEDNTRDPVPNRPRSIPGTPTLSRNTRGSTSALKAPRMTKKASKAAEQARREVYAQELFDELNECVFDDGLPKETRLVWSNRLITTAGKANWQRTRDGVHTASIQLAMKVLDEDERIRNTLSHEMCHLACWIISAEPKENHGKIFKAWAAKVMRTRPDIEITTRHDYEIKYPYEWKCQECSKIYGRFSKSIRPDECVCGACKVGRLQPLFEVKTRTPRTPKTTANSRMAATTPRDSPHPASPAVDAVIDLTVDVNVVDTPTKTKKRKEKTVVPEVDSEIDAILNRIKSVKIGLE
ncbi:unnamed protein product [Somion occarium]|uniref:SprT-like domain-containing protein n=1 Tax=Somion occarium TaxID=3059160 RepID=A0ABP1CPV7_9APHY